MRLLRFKAEFLILSNKAKSLPSWQGLPILGSTVDTQREVRMCQNKLEWPISALTQTVTTIPGLLRG